MDFFNGEAALDLARDLGAIAVESSQTIAMLAVIVTIGIFIVQSRRAARIERQENYLRLELASNDVFRFDADNAAVLTKFRTPTPAKEAFSETEQAIVDCFFFMTLNLFEISIRFRRDGTVDKHVFGSWVVWYYDTLCGWRFREQWPRLRENYTKELREVFDVPVASFDPTALDEDRKMQFFLHVGKILKCPIVKEWLSDRPLGGGKSRVAVGKERPGKADA